MGKLKNTFLTFNYILRYLKFVYIFTAFTNIVMIN